MARRPTVALVDDEIDLASAFAEYLQDLGYDTALAATGEQGWALVEGRVIDLVVLDLNMPGEGGLALLRRLRQEPDLRIPVLIMTANPEPIERVIGLEIGADDFVVKPVAPRELAARIGGLLRRAGTAPRDVLALERATADLTASRLLRHGQAPERLGAGEVVLLRAFARHPNEVLSRDALLDLAPAEARDPDARAIDTRIARLRRKLDTDAIVTVHGRGYMFVPPPLDVEHGG